jgi:hypothetical protein
MSILAPAQEHEELPPQQENDRRLAAASEQFMHGEITAEQFEEAERRYMPDYRSAFLTFARRRRAINQSSEAQSRKADLSIRRFARSKAMRILGY